MDITTTSTTIIEIERRKTNLIRLAFNMHLLGYKRLLALNKQSPEKAAL